jgi:hypothetical protein
MHGDAKGLEKIMTHHSAQSRHGPPRPLLVAIFHFCSAVAPVPAWAIA